MAHSLTRNVAQYLGTIRLQLRFLMIMLPVFLLATTVGMRVIANTTFGDEKSVLTAQIGNLAARAATTLNRLPANTPASQIQDILGLLLAEPAVSCAILMDSSRVPIAMAPPRVGCSGAIGEAQIEIAVSNLNGATLCVKYNLNELAERSALMKSFTMLAVLVAFLVAGLSATYAFRRIVGRPIEEILSAIRQTRNSGKPVRINISQNDALGSVISAFNSMQDEIENKDIEVKKNLRQLEGFYNETPAIMFSVDRDGNITHASGHWLDHAGYQREEIIGKPAQQFLLSVNSTELECSWKSFASSTEQTADLPFQLLCKDGSFRDVMLNAVADQDDSKLCVLSDVTSLKTAQKELVALTLTDHLTKLPNRKGLFDHLANLKSTAGKHVAVMFIDLDNFKVVNDTLGHEAGDVLLQAAAGRLMSCIAKRDFLARLGGDEFAIVLHELALESDAEHVAKRIVESFAAPFRIGEALANVGTSIGISLLDETCNGDEALRLADLAMYEAKQSGKNCTATYSVGMQAKVIARNVMAKAIQDGLTHNQFELYLQPIVDLQAMQAVGAEALLRLNCPERGVVSPASIIQAAEETGLIKPITAWTMKQAMAMIDRHTNAATSDTYIALNVSANEVTEEFADTVIATFDGHPDYAKSLVLEITETTLFKKDENAIHILSRLRKAGCRIALDDFGTGYSSLAHLHSYPVDIIKLDRSFVSVLATSTDSAKRSRVLIGATSAMAREMDIKIVAEGIENLETLELLRDFGIEYGQGYLFSPPMPERVWANWNSSFVTRSKAAPFKTNSELARLAG